MITVQKMRTTFKARETRNDHNSYSIMYKENFIHEKTERSQGRKTSPTLLEKKIRHLMSLGRNEKEKLAKWAARQTWHSHFTARKITYLFMWKQTHTAIWEKAVFYCLHHKAMSSSKCIFHTDLQVVTALIPLTLTWCLVHSVQGRRVNSSVWYIE